MTIDMQHTINGGSRGGLFGQHETTVLGSLSEIVGNAHSPNARLKARLIGNRFDTMTVDKNSGAVATQTFSVLGSRHNSTAISHQHTVILSAWLAQL
jgi:hypothetical protein